MWRKERIGLKVPDPELGAELMALEGAEAWTVGKGSTMSWWILVPEDFHDDTCALEHWVAISHEFALITGPPPKRKRKKKQKKADD